jgi:hypothetical protein
MSAAADSAPPWGSQDKAGSRNKRKFSVASGELAAIELECPTTVYYAGSEFTAAEKPTMAAAAAGEGVNLDIPQNVCTFSGLESLESDWRMNWTNLDEVQLEELLLKGLDATFDNAVSLITAMGYSEAVGRAAVVIAAKQFQWKDGLAWFGKFAVEVAIDILKTKGSILREDVSVEIMRRCGRAVLTGVIDHVSDANPLSPRGDVMFCLLMSDMNAIRACTMVSTQAPSPAVGAQVIAQPVVGNYEPGLSSGVPASFTNPQTGDVIRGKLFTVAPSSFNPQAVRAHSSTVPACPNLSSSKPSVSGNMQCVISNMKPKEHTVAVPDHSEGQPFVAAATQASKDDKPFTSKRGSSKRDSSHRKKLMSSDKSSRAMGSKGSLRSGKHNSLGTAALDRKCRQFTDSSANSLEGSSNVGKGFSAVMKGSELSVDHSFTSAASSAPSLDTNKATSANPVPATNTDLPLSLSSSSDVSVPSQDKNSNVEAKDAISKINCSYDEDQKAWIPQGRKAELVSILVRRQKEMQARMQDSTAWAQDKVVRAARHLAKEKEELQALRKEKEESDRLQEEERTLEENTRKKILEMESAISRTNAHLEKVDASARRREAENAQLRIQLDAAKRHEVESAIKLDELSRKNEETLKRSQYCESERAVLQDELAAEKSKLSKVLQQLQHSKEKGDQIQVIAIFCLPIHNVHIKLTIFHEKHRGSNPMNQDQSLIYGSCLI